MRTTLTLDEDVATKLAAEARSSGRSFKAVVNEALRRGLMRTGISHPPFRVKSKSLGLRPGIELANVEELLTRLDGPDRR